MFYSPKTKGFACRALKASPFC